MGCLAARRRLHGRACHQLHPALCRTIAALHRSGTHYIWKMMAGGIENVFIQMSAASYSSLESQGISIKAHAASS